MAGNHSEQEESGLPRWFYALRSTVMLGAGTLIVLHEAFSQIDPPGPVTFVVGLALMGFPLVDLASFFRR